MMYYDFMLPGILGNLSSDRTFIESDKCYKAEIEVPGMTKADFTVVLEGSELVIKSKKDARKDLTYSMTIPTDSYAKGITAQVENGLMTLVIPKRTEAMKREIKIQGGE